MGGDEDEGEVGDGPAGRMWLGLGVASSSSCRSSLWRLLDKGDGEGEAGDSEDRGDDSFILDDLDPGMKPDRKLTIPATLPLPFKLSSATRSISGVNILVSL